MWGRGRGPAQRPPYILLAHGAVGADVEEMAPSLQTPAGAPSGGTPGALVPRSVGTHLGGWLVGISPGRPVPGLSRAWLPALLPSWPFPGVRVWLALRTPWGGMHPTGRNTGFRGETCSRLMNHCLS